MIVELVQTVTLENAPEWMDPVYWRYFRYLPVFVAGFIATLILTPVIGQIANKFDIVNDTKENIRNKLNKHENDERRINPNKVPLLGGLAVLIPLIILIVVAFGVNPVTIPILLALTILIVAGVLDDIYNLPATVQFLIQFLAAAIVAFSIVDLEFVKIPFDGLIHLDMYKFAFENSVIPISITLPGDLLMILWIMILINAIKWVGGVDALLESNVSIAFLLLFVIALRSSNAFVAVTSIFLFGSILSFVFYNFPPAKIFTGSTGKTAYGFLIAVLAIINDTKFAITIMILLLPLVDFLFVLVKRSTANKPQNAKEIALHPIRVMRMADTNHLHHQFLKIGLSPKQVLLVEVSFALSIGIIAVSVTEAYRLGIVLLMALLVAIGILIIHKLANRKQDDDEDEKDDPPDRESPESRYSY